MHDQTNQTSNDQTEQPPQPEYKRAKGGRFAPGTRGGPGRPRNDALRGLQHDATPREIIRDELRALDAAGRAWAALEALHSLARAIALEHQPTVVAIYATDPPKFDGNIDSHLAQTIDAAIAAISERWQHWPELV